MQKHHPIVLSGSISIDRIMNFAGSYKNLIKPDKLHVLSLSVLIDQLQDSRGGTAANIAYNLALLGDHPYLLGSIGLNSLEYLMDLKKIGVEITHVNQSSLPTATFTVMTDQDDNQIGGFYPGAMNDHQKLNLAPWHGTNALVVISANNPTLMRNLIQEASHHQLTLIYDPGQQVSNCPESDLLKGLNVARILFVNDYELTMLATRTNQTETQLKSTIPLIVTTLGKDGCEISGKLIPNSFRIPSVPNIKAIDPTGAGDAFRAGFLYGYSRNWSPENCAKLGNVIASYTVEKHGTQTHTFSKIDLKKRYNATYKTKLII